MVPMVAQLAWLKRVFPADKDPQVARVTCVFKSVYLARNLRNPVFCIPNGLCVYILLPRVPLQELWVLHLSAPRVAEFSESGFRRTELDLYIEWSLGRRRSLDTL